MFCSSICAMANCSPWCFYSQLAFVSFSLGFAGFCFSSSIEVVNTCLDYCLDLMLERLGIAPPLGLPPFPRRLPTLPVFQPHIGSGSRRPTRLGLVFQLPTAQSGGYPTRTGPWSSNAPTGQPGGTSLRRGPAHRLWSPGHPSPAGQAPLSGAAHLGGEG